VIQCRHFPGGRRAGPVNAGQEAEVREQMLRRVVAAGEPTLSRGDAPAPALFPHGKATMISTGSEI
jgi:hypothetical protein